MENDNHNKYFKSRKGDLGNLHSLETFGTVDGPGIRFVVFAQGCPLRCQYCHNPDTFDTEKAPIKISSKDLLEEVLKYKTYFQKRGGITFSGGEPFFQAEFVRDFFKLCKKENIHTAVDTSGYFLNDTVKEALQYTDLVLLDIKTINKNLHPILTGVKAHNTLKFLNYLQEINKPTWIRHVLVPGITYNELLPYHSFGAFKYKELNKTYPLENTPELTKEELKKAKDIFIKNGLTVL